MKRDATGFAALALFVTASGAAAQRPAPLAGATTPLTSGWQNAGSDVPTDPDWRQGVLANGLRYAVRRSSRPQGGVSLRVRIGVGGLYESDREQGWSHLLEHMTFRGTKHFADGEGIRMWQRLGASFGSDTNAQTDLTQTTYQLDLPHPDAAGLRQAMRVVAEMMDTARIDPAALATERKVVEAELALRLTPLARKFRDAQQPLLYAGTKAATRDVIGTPATLANADAASLRAYYEAWYRPENAVVVVAGDMDPVALEAEVRRAFGGWRASVPPRPQPDWGTPATPPVPAATVTDPQAPGSIAIAFVSPHPAGPMTAARQQRQYLEGLAINVLNQRFAQAARRGEAILNAGVSFSDQLHVEDRMTVYVQPRAGAWRAALDQAYGIINGALSRTPSQAEVDQAIAVFSESLRQRAVSASSRTAMALANGFVGDVDDGDVSAAPAWYASLFEGLRKGATPTVVGDAMKRLLAPAPRLVVAGPDPIDGGATTAVAALKSAEKAAGGAAADLRAVSLDQLTLPGTPTQAGPPTAIAELGVRRYRFGNGIELTFKRTAFEKDRVYVAVRLGSGLLGEEPGRPTLLPSVSALATAGVGPFDADEIARLTAGHQYGFVIRPDTDALVLSGVTNADDVAGMLKLMTGAIVSPRFDQRSVERMRDAALANYAAVYSQPGSVLSAFGGAALHGGDARFTSLPPRSVIETLTMAQYREFWTRRLAEGPVRVTIVGDVDPAVAIAAIGGTLGRMASRDGTVPSGTGVRANLSTQLVELEHRGDPDQTMLLRGWPVPSGTDDRSTSTALDLAAAIIQTELTEGFRETQGGTYSPFASNVDAVELPHYGLFIAGAQVSVAKRADFEAALDATIRALAAKGPSRDALGRAQATAVGVVDRSRQSNQWWLAVLGRPLTAERIAELTQRRADILAVKPDAVRAAAALLTQRNGFDLKVVPTPQTR